MRSEDLKRIIIQETINLLHRDQLDMIDEAVERSDLTQAKELIDYIRNKE